ncbi:hypothetical protein [Nocardioides sp. B-3]|uniref:hypothetical protein n=1 Tax=Nocardioides sp. B-3 TaxID=2895565 RepID=UPI002152F736|nr:hypothetical protein [Nocardioides sp. B-3]UUZ59749.1 hypothetical protein LP418_01100 [Nocardioides sp. B-3]
MRPIAPGTALLFHPDSGRTPPIPVIVRVAGVAPVDPPAQLVPEPDVHGVVVTP